MKKYHKYSELNKYPSELVFSDEVIAFFEEQIKSRQNQKKSNSRHISDYTIEEAENSGEIVNIPVTVEEIVLKNESNSVLYESFNILTETQLRRIKMYFYYQMPLEEIARHEKASFQSVSESIDAGMKKIECFFKNYHLVP